jgi:hypothetical protein
MAVFWKRSFRYRAEWFGRKALRTESLVRWSARMIFNDYERKNEDMRDFASLTLLAAGLALAVPAFAQSTGTQQEPGHPRVNEVDQRLQDQQKRIQNGTQDSQIGAKQAAHDEKVDSRISQEASRDEAAHGGHLTKRETHHINRQLNRSSRKIHHQRHT